MSAERKTSKNGRWIVAEVDSFDGQVRILGGGRYSAKADAEWHAAEIRKNWPMVQVVDLEECEQHLFHVEKICPGCDQPGRLSEIHPETKDAICSDCRNILKVKEKR